MSSPGQTAPGNGGRFFVYGLGMPAKPITAYISAYSITPDKISVTMDPESFLALARFIDLGRIAAMDVLDHDEITPEHYELAAAFLSLRGAVRGLQPQKALDS